MRKFREISMFRGQKALTKYFFLFTWLTINERILPVKNVIKCQARFSHVVARCYVNFHIFIMSTTLLIWVVARVEERERSREVESQSNLFHDVVDWVKIFQQLFSRFSFFTHDLHIFTLFIKIKLISHWM